MNRRSCDGRSAERIGSLQEGGAAWISTGLYVAKSGGRMIESVEEFEEIVLAAESQRPVLAFFSAAW